MDDTAVKRTLFAIVMADVVGYSRMMGEDEAGTLQRMNQYRGDFIDGAISRHRGWIVNTAGDSLLLAFGSVIDATRCAIALQQTVADRNAALPEPKRLTFRMGVNIGDVIVQGRSLFGDGVNVAARLQTLAEPGGICVSSAVYEQIRGKIDAPFADFGAHQVKNIARAIEVFALSPQAMDAMPRQPAPGPERSRRRLALAGGIAVLVLAAGAGAVQYGGTRMDLAAQLDPVLSETQARLNDRTRAKLVADYLTIGVHRAFAIAPKAQSHWWTGDWSSAESAAEKALERCQLAFDEPCALIAIDEARVPRLDDDPRVAQAMSKLRYAGEFDPAQIPGIRQLVGTRADIVGYLAAPSPKAAAIHPRGVVSIVTGATSDRRAQSQALKRCNDDTARKDADGPCYLYALGNKVVLPQRLTSPIVNP